MKKKLKIFLLVFGIIVLGASSYLLYILKFKQYDVADEAVAEIMEDPYAIELPDGTQITIDEDGEVVDLEEESDATAGSTITKTEDDKSSSGNKGTSVNTGNASSTDKGDTSKKPTVAVIKNKYIPTFETLQSQADDKLNALIGHAKKEFNDKKSNGESIDFAYFYNKYNNAAKDLEARTDSVFNGVLIAVEKDLVANGYDKSYAQSMLDDYNAKKKERRDSLMKKALGR